MANSADIIKQLDDIIKDKNNIVKSVEYIKLINTFLDNVNTLHKENRAFVLKKIIQVLLLLTNDEDGDVNFRKLGDKEKNNGFFSKFKNIFKFFNKDIIDSTIYDSESTFQAGFEKADKLIKKYINESKKYVTKTSKDIADLHIHQKNMKHVLEKNNIKINNSVDNGKKNKLVKNERNNAVSM